MAGGGELRQQMAGGGELRQQMAGGGEPRQQMASGRGNRGRGADRGILGSAGQQGKNSKYSHCTEG
jgi:hypothetical protein